MGKTTLLSRLREVNESTTAASTFNERVRGEEKERGGGGSGRGRKKGGVLTVALHTPAIVDVFSMVDWPVLSPTCFQKVRKV